MKSKTRVARVTKKKVPKWAIQPFNRCLNFLKEIDSLLVLSIRGIGGLRGVYALSKAIQEVDTLKCGHEDKKSEITDVKLKDMKIISQLAESETKKGFPVLITHALISLWSTLEILIDDLVVAWLSNKPELLHHDRLAKVKIRLAMFLKLSEEDRILFLAEEIKRHHGVVYKKGIEGFEEILSYLTLTGAVNVSTKQKLIELKEIRNVYIHRGGNIDHRAIEMCKWMKWKKRQKVEIDFKGYRKYYETVCKYALCLVNRMRKYFGVKAYKVGKRNE